jgi:transposase
LALLLFLEGFSLRFTGKILNISYGTVYRWIKEWSVHTSLPRREISVEPSDLDNMLAYIMSKKDATQYGLLLTDLDNNISILSKSITLSIKD